MIVKILSTHITSISTIGNMNIVPSQISIETVRISNLREPKQKGSIDAFFSVIAKLQMVYNGFNA